MRIAVLIHNRHVTGPYPKVLELASTRADSAVDVSLAYTAPGARLRLREQREVRFVIAPNLLWGRLRQGADPWNALRRAIHLRESFDIVHAIDCRLTVLLPALWLKRRGAKLIVSWWDLFAAGGAMRNRSGPLYVVTVRRLADLFEQRFRGYADRATVITAHLAERLRSLGYPADRILLQRLGCDTKRFRLQRTVDARQRVSLQLERPPPVLRRGHLAG